MKHHLSTKRELARQSARVGASVGRLIATTRDLNQKAAAERQRLEDEKLKRIGEPWWDK